MIKLNKFTIKETCATANWSFFSLLSIDVKSHKTVLVAGCSFATGMIDKYPKSTKAKAQENIEKLKQYLIDNDIKTESDWAQKASQKAKYTFVECFNMTATAAPFFSNNI